MIINSLMASLHHVFAFIITACLIYEFVAYRKGLGIEEARRIQHIDTVYGIASGLLIVVGLLRVFYFEKGSSFYFHNYLYWTKMALFVIVGLLSIYPTIRFLKWSSALKENLPPEIPDEEFKRIRMFIWLELAGIVLILFAAPMIARGIGMM